MFQLEKDSDYKDSDERDSTVNKNKEVLIKCSLSTLTGAVYIWLVSCDIFQNHTLLPSSIWIFLTCWRCVRTLFLIIVLFHKPADVMVENETADYYHTNRGWCMNFTHGEFEFWLGRCLWYIIEYLLSHRDAGCHLWFWIAMKRHTINL